MALPIASRRSTRHTGSNAAAGGVQQSRPTSGRHHLSSVDAPYRNLRPRLSLVGSSEEEHKSRPARNDHSGRKGSSSQAVAARTTRQPSTRSKRSIKDLAVVTNTKNFKDAPLSRSKKQKLNQVTPSPAAVSAHCSSAAFTFTVDSKHKKKKSRVFGALPKGVIDLYPSKDSAELKRFCTTFSCFCEQDDCSPRALSACYIEAYGKEYCQAMKDAEKPIITASVSVNGGSKPRSDSYSFSRSSSGFFNDDDSDNHIHSESSHETPARRRVWSSNLNTSGLSPIKAAESSRFLDYQPDLTPKMRAILMDWIVELSEHFGFGPSTLHLACTLVDHVLVCGPLSFDFDEQDDEDAGNDGESKTNCFLISRDKFQLLGATCTWLACKMEEQSPPQVAQIAYVSGMLHGRFFLYTIAWCDGLPAIRKRSNILFHQSTDNIYTVEQIKRMERRVCNALGFAVFRQTPYNFIHEFLRASQECANAGCEAPDKFRFMVLYLLELGRLTYIPVTKKPSLLAAAAIYLARVTFNMEPWSKTLEFYTGYKQKDLFELVTAIHSYQEAAEESSLKSCFNKYKLKKYCRVALKTVPRIEDLGFHRAE